MPESRSPEPTTIAVAVCTYQRNEPLRRLLTAIERNAEQLGRRAVVGVVVVDDNPDGAARPVCDEYASRFELGLHYRSSGQGNISLARNLALETALPLAEWVAMTDDDCEPVDGWLAAYLDAHARFGGDALTGPCRLTPSPGAPRWLIDQPFLDDAQFRFEDGTALTVGATNNSFLPSRFLAAHERLRFDPELGVVGGEDMVFFRTAVREGMAIRFAARAEVLGHEPPDRCGLGYQLRSRFWLGNTEFVTNHALGEASRVRWLARGARDLVAAVLRPLRQLATAKPPQVRYALARSARAVGLIAGAVGIRVAHH